MNTQIKGNFGSNVFDQNGIEIPIDELRKSARTLIGKPIMLGINGKTIGKVICAEFCEEDQRVHWKAEIEEDINERLRLQAEAIEIETNQRPKYDKVRIRQFDGFFILRET